MKKITLIYLFSFLFCLLNVSLVQGQEKMKTAFGKVIKASSINPSTGHVRCFTEEYEKYLQETNPKRLTDAQFEAWLAPLIQEYKANQTLSSESGGIITIPVVVHVIHNGDAYGVSENISDEQVQSQITVMNQDFRRIVGTPGYNTNTVGVDTQIQFALAKVDPSGNPTNGIDRQNLCQESFSTGEINSTVKPTTFWDPTLYMNMWSVNFTDASLLGYAQFPDASGLGGLNASGGAANTDGVVAGYKFFGSSALASGAFQAPYDRGRTMTHEVGHWIGLRHIWGDGGCNVDDFCADTPAAASSNFGCPVGTDSCPAAGVDMIENYMDYTDDTCMNIFTQNQKDRMVVIMNNSARRASLKTSTKDIAITLFANDAEVNIEKNCSSASATCATGSGPSQKISLYNRGTATLTSASLTYNLNGGTAQSFNWTGSLAPNKYAIVDLPLTNPTNGTFNVSIVNANGAADQRASNNTKSAAFTAPTGLQSFAFTNLKFNLVGDRYGSETTWNLKNSAGTTLYSGGPYTDLGTNVSQVLVTNQPWTLANNDCYTFTINDSYGDGICCLYGSGSWTITENGGASAPVASGGTFTATQTKSFNIGTLSSVDFNNLKQITLYPNPTNNILNISMPTGSELPSAIEIHNSLGQTLTKKSISTESDLAFDVSSLNSGVYFITIQKESEKRTLRFIKN
ncbi:M43 family zinc metalloprotease [uncultured Flavobacterium sp.]|uniref:M43 family zinc metalloprotease n=1 Tax=uncultured Flavobacterium sp. TaxID=165435 RepID=UPI0030EF24DF|tara:strand:- start:46441 stop:48495 length:2055 start_codon:yes stop_codon:yes gene_type:complete